MSARKRQSKAAAARKGRSAARLHAVQALYQVEVGADAPTAVIAQFLRHRLGADVDGEQMVSADADFFQDIVTGTIARQSEIDGFVADGLTGGYTVDRLETLLRALLRAGSYELLVRADVPAKVIINEYVDVAHAFFGGSEPTLANAVLDRVARATREGEVGTNS